MESAENINDVIEEQRMPASNSKDGTLENPSAAGANPYMPAFTESNLESHWASHKNEYTGMTKEQYAQRAHDLIRSATSESILGYKSKNGSIVRYDKNTHDFVQGFDTGIATMFKLKGGESRFNKKKQRSEVEV